MNDEDIKTTARIVRNIELESLRCRARSIEGLLKIHDGNSQLAIELAITLGQIDLISLSVARRANED